MCCAAILIVCFCVYFVFKSFYQLYINIFGDHVALKGRINQFSVCDCSCISYADRSSRSFLLVAGIYRLAASREMLNLKAA